MFEFDPIKSAKSQRVVSVKCLLCVCTGPARGQLAQPEEVSNTHALNGLGRGVDFGAHVLLHGGQLSLE